MKEKKLRIDLYRREKIAEYWINLAKESERPISNHDNHSSSISEASELENMTLSERTELAIKQKAKTFE